MLWASYSPLLNLTTRSMMPPVGGQSGFGRLFRCRSAHDCPRALPVVRRDLTDLLRRGGRTALEGNYRRGGGGRGRVKSSLSWTEKVPVNMRRAFTSSAFGAVDDVAAQAGDARDAR